MARHAVMLIHSFSATKEGLDDYCFFAEQLGARGDEGELVHVGQRNGIELHIGWASGNVPQLSTRDRLARDQEVQ